MSVRFTGQDSPLFKTTEDVQANLRGKVSAAYSVKDHITFAGDGLRDSVLGRNALPEEQADAPENDFSEIVDDEAAAEAAPIGAGDAETSIPGDLSGGFGGDSPNGAGEDFGNAPARTDLFLAK